MEKNEISNGETFVFRPSHTNTSMSLPIYIGQNAAKTPVYKDLTKAIHLLVAGSTGSGKSVFINALIASLLNSKVCLKFTLIDPKRVELASFKELGKEWFFNSDGPVTEAMKAFQSLNDLCAEMDKRYLCLQELKVRNIGEANIKGANLPYIVCVIDEFADLILTNKEIEIPIIRLAQLGRACGIHLVLATQRPSSNVITGIIKANFPSRIAFRTASNIDSRIILDRSGAELLNGNGDMFWSNGADLERIQGHFISEIELETMIQSKKVTNASLQSSSTFELNETAIVSANLFYEFGNVSAAFLQRKLKIGFTQANNIVESLILANVIIATREGKLKLKMSYTTFTRSFKELND